MSASAAVVQNNKKSIFVDILRIGLFSFVICTILVLILALIIKLFQIPDSALSIIMQAVKAVSVAAGCIIAVRGEKGLIKGFLGALLFVLLATVINAIFGGQFQWAQLGIDAGICCALGAVTGAVVGSKRSQ